jgi:hypothetical protein
MATCTTARLPAVSGKGFIATGSVGMTTSRTVRPSAAGGAVVSVAGPSVVLVVSAGAAVVVLPASGSGVEQATTLRASARASANHLAFGHLEYGHLTFGTFFMDPPMWSEPAEATVERILISYNLFVKTFVIWPIPTT